MALSSAPLALPPPPSTDDPPSSVEEDDSLARSNKRMKETVDSMDADPAPPQEPKSSRTR